MSARRLGAAILGSALAAGCTFLIDFDELQRGRKNVTPDAGAGAGGGENDGSSPGSGGTTGSGGRKTDASVPGDAATDAAVDAPPACDSSCADSDPCTVDTCEKDGCRHTYTAGFGDDGLSETVLGSKFHRVTMTANGDRFYLSALESQNGNYDVQLRHFSRTDAKLAAPRSLSTEAGLGEQPVSALGLTPGAAGLEIIAYGALGTTPSAPAKVYRMSFDLAAMKLNSIALAAADANYLGSPVTHPVAWSEGVPGIWGAWPANGPGIYIDDGKAMIASGTPPTMSTNAQVVALAPLGVSNGPGLLYVTDKPYVRANGQLFAFGPPQCDTRPGAYTTAFSGFTGLPGVWIGGWTKNVTAGPLTEQLPLLCYNGTLGGNCVTATACNGDEQLLTGVRNPAVTSAHVQGEPATRLYEVLVLPVVDTSKKESSLSVQIIRADFGQPDSGVETTFLTPGAVTIARGKTDVLLEGPDLPAVAYLGPDKFAVAWIQRAATGTEGDELHVERKRICFPK